MNARTPACLLVAILLCAPAARAEPFLVRNQNPLLAPYGLPKPLPARLPAAGAAAWSTSLQWTSAAYAESAADRSFEVDAESLEVRLRYLRSLGPRAAVYAELPWRRTWEGVLDGFIDTWHDITGLPGAEREGQPRNRLLIAYQADGESLYRFDQPRSGLGDLPLGAGYQLFASPGAAVSAWLTVKLPTGAADRLTGSGAVDVALSVAAERAVGERASLFGQVDVTRLGAGDLLPGLQEDLAWSGLAGLRVRAWRRLELAAQLAANSRVFAAPGPAAGDALVLAFGGSWRGPGGWRLDLAIAEDVDVNASPDVSFNLAVSRVLR